MEKWLAVDLDGTLAYYDGWKVDIITGKPLIGHPIKGIVEQVRDRHEDGWKIAIFTARADNNESVVDIVDWCKKYGIPCDMVTNIKSKKFKEFWDDRAYHVPRNSGVIMCGTHTVKQPNSPNDADQVQTKKDQSPLDVQVGGDHYKGMAIQPIEFVFKNNIPAIEASVIKYICRHRNKNGVEDLKKARHLIDLLVEMEYKDK